MIQKEYPTIVTHNGTFHADDVVGVAVLLALYPSASLTRTRDPEVIKQSDFAVDVGGEFNPANGRFDHHQIEFNGSRFEGKGKYASAGLVWNTYGAAFVEKFVELEPGVSAQEVAQMVDRDFIMYVDQMDTGEANAAEGRFGYSALIDSLNPTQKEIDKGVRELCTEAFLRRDAFLSAVKLTRPLLERAVITAADTLAGYAKVRKAISHEGGRILQMPEPGLSWTKVVCAEFPEALFVIFEDTANKNYMVQTVPVEPGSFTARKSLPETWAGLRANDLAAVTGVEDSVFCHTGRFIGGAVSLEGALKLAELAVKA